MSFRFITPRVDVGDGIEDFAGAKLFFFDFGTNDAKITKSDVTLQIDNTDPVIADDNGLFGEIFLDIAFTVTLKTANDVVIWGPLDVQSPNELVTALAASAVTVLDTAGNFDDSDLESVLAQLALDWFRLDRTNAITNILTFSGAGEIRMTDLLLRRPVLVDYGVDHNNAQSVGGTLTLDLTTGNSFRTTLTENTTVVLSNPSPSGVLSELMIRIVQDGAGGAFTVTWPVEVKWPSGTAPVITVTNNAEDRVTLSTDDEGAQWYGDFSQAYSA